MQSLKIRIHVTGKIVGIAVGCFLSISLYGGGGFFWTDIFSGDSIFQNKCTNSPMPQSRWTRALTDFTRILGTTREPFQRSIIHQNMGGICYMLSRYEEAALHFSRAISLVKVDSLQHPVMLTDLYCNLASTYLEMWKVEEAEIWLTEARNLALEATCKQQIRMNMIEGGIQYQQSAFHKAIKSYRKSLRCREPWALEQIWIEKNIACCFLELNQYDSAIQILLPIILQLQPQDQLIEKDALISKEEILTELYYVSGHIYLAQGEWLEAYRCFDYGIQLLDRQWIGGALNDKSLEIQQYRFKASQLIAEYGMVDWNSNPEVGVRLWIINTLKILEHGESQIGNAVSGNVLWINRILQITLYDLLINRLWEEQQFSDSEKERVFSLMQRSKAFQQWISSGPQYSRDHVFDSVTNPGNPNRSTLFRLHKQLMHHGSLIPESAPFQDEPFFDSGINPGDPPDSLPSILNPFQIPSLNEIQESLRFNEALISYYKAGELFYLFVITSDVVSVQRKRYTPEISSLITTYIRSAAKGAFNEFSTSSQMLFSWFVSGNYQVIEDKQHWLLFPDQVHSLLPVDAMMDSLGRYIAQNHEVSYHRDLASWISKRSDNQKRNQKFSWDFYGYSPYVAGSGTSVCNSSRMPVLSESAIELNHLATRFSAVGLKVKVSDDPFFNEDKFIHEACQARVIHLALHGERNRWHPECSGWILSDDPHPSPSPYDPDGKLEVGELQFNQFNAYLLTLSSCPAGIIQPQRWRQIQQVPFGFFDAGVENILFATWNVSDFHTRLLMEQFYQNWLQGETLSGALQRAKKWMIHNVKTANPIFWASWMLWSR